MKEVVVTFKISDKQKIEIYFPDIKNKFNYYYEPTDQLHKFDEVTVAYQINSKKIILSTEIINENLITFYDLLSKTLKNELELPQNIEKGNLGFFLNEENQWENNQSKKTSNIDFFRYWVWSSRGIQTWIYNFENKIYIEISPNYPWHNREPENDEKFITYENFIKDYKPIAILEIDKQTAKKWLEQCEKIIQELNKNP